MYPLHDNDLDRLSREAADRFEVEPGASGWAHLEKRLDQELPQKKKRRRFLFWLFFITVSTGGALTGILSYQPISPLAKNVTGVISPAGKTGLTENNTPVGSIDDATNSTVNGNTTTSGSNEIAAQQSKTTSPNPVANNQQPATSLSTPKSGAADNQPATVLATTPDQKITQPGVKAGNAKKIKTTTPQPAIDKAPLTLNYATITPNNNRIGNSGRTTKPSKRKPGQYQNTAGQHNATIPEQEAVTAPVTGVTANDQQPIDDKQVDANNDLTTNKAVIPTQSESLKDNKTTVQPAPDSTQNLAQQKKEDRKKDKIKQPLELGLMAGPDLSSVAFGPMYKTGYNFGLQVGYRFSNRWSVNAGLIYTKKFYQADSTHFEYKNTWGRQAEKMEGNCSMWEIPINVRYDVSYNDKRRWFVSTGLSTYLMDKEDYKLYYNWTGIPYPTYWSTDSNSNYPFSIWNLSAGMERSLSKHFSLQAEPYLKVPLRDLGTGKIRMDSYGILFTLKYKPGFRAKQTGKQ